MAPRVTRPAELPEQRGPQHARALARPGVRPPSEASPRRARRALPRARPHSVLWDDLFDEKFCDRLAAVCGGVVLTLTILGAIAAIAFVGAWWVGL